MHSTIKIIWRQCRTYINLLSHWGLKYECPICGFIVDTLKLQQKHPRFGLNPNEVLFIGRK